MALVHKDDYYETPEWVLYDIMEKTGIKFIFDASANMNNSKCDLYCSESEDFLISEHSISHYPIWCNPPRSKNGKFVKKLLELWNTQGGDIVILLTWNDFGNKYCDEIRPLIGTDKIKVFNYGKIIFDKNGIKSKWPSRLNYCAVWLKGK